MYEDNVFVFKATFQDVDTLRKFDKMFVFPAGDDWLMAVASTQDIIREAEEVSGKELILTTLECLGLALLKSKPEPSD